MPDKLERGVARFQRGADIKKSQLIRALFAIERRKFYRISRILKVLKVHTLHNPTAVDVETGNDPDGQGH